MPIVKPSVVLFVLKVNKTMFHPLILTDMKKLINTILIALVATLLTSCMALQGGAYAQNGYDRDYGYYDDDDYYGDDDYYYGDNNYDNRDGVSIQVFYNTLRPHGRWMRHSSYGEIWIPRVGRNFHPYATNGYWVMTNYGNTWVSDFSWGWAPFHYGRWFYDDYYGWAWIPGYEWAPAWVTWRTGGGYYGWAPMGPRMGINIHINLPINYWVFLPNRYMYHRNMHRYYPGRNFHHNIYNKTTIINNTYVYNNNRYYSGPTANEYRSTTGRSVNVRTLETNGRSGRTAVNDRSVSVYTPGNSRSGGGGNVSRSGNTSPATRGTVNSGARSSEVNRNATTRTAGTSNREAINNRPDNNRNTPARSSNSTREINNSRSSNGGSSRTVAPQQTSKSRNANVSRSSSSSSSSRSNEATVRSQRSSGSNSRSNAAVRSQSSSSSRNSGSVASTRNTENSSSRSSSGRR